MLIFVFTLLQPQLPVQTSPIYLGPTGTVLLILITIFFGFLALRQRSWKTTADASAAELTVQRATCERLRDEKNTLQSEKDKLATENTRLHTQTDLKPLVESITGWILEGRTRFDQAQIDLRSNREALDKGIRELFSEVASARSVSEEAFRTYTTSFVTHVEEDRASTVKILQMFSVIEQRLNEGCCQGWSTKVGNDVDR